jgi:hypothetical protein
MKQLEFKGTKGEWVSLTPNTTKGWVDITSDKGVISRTFYGTLEPTVDKSESLYNAKLIAVAPELLKALQESQRYLVELGTTESGMAYHKNMKAINKALK